MSNCHEFICPLCFEEQSFDLSLKNAKLYPPHCGCYMSSKVHFLANAEGFLIAREIILFHRQEKARREENFHQRTESILRCLRDLLRDL